MQGAEIGCLWVSGWKRAERKETNDPELEGGTLTPARSTTRPAGRALSSDRVGQLVVDKVDRLVAVHDAENEEEDRAAERDCVQGRRQAVSTAHNAKPQTGGLAMLDRDVLRDPTSSEDGTAGADRVPKGGSEGHDPDVLGNEADQSSVVRAVRVEIPTCAAPRAMVVI